MIRVVPLQQRKQVAHHNEGDIERVVGCAQSFADEIEGALRSFTRHGNHAKRPQRARFQVASYHAAWSCFQNVIGAFVKPAVVIARAGEPGDEARETRRVGKEQDVAGKWPVGAGAFGRLRDGRGGVNSGGSGAPRGKTPHV